MDVIRRADLECLALHGAGPSVSLFLPTHRAGPEVQQAPIRLKNLLRQATEALQADGVRPAMVHSVLAPLRRLVNDGLFWRYQSDGLALYSRPGWWRALRVPLDLPELAVVADRFHISPLLPLLTGDGHYFVLALSQHQIRLLEGTRDRLEEVHLPGGPAGGSRRPPGTGGPEAAAAVCRRPRRGGRQRDLPRPRLRRRHPDGAGAAVLPQGQPGAARGPGRRARPDGPGRRGAPGAALAPGQHLPPPGRPGLRRQPGGAGPPRAARAGLGGRRAPVPRGSGRGGREVPQACRYRADLPRSPGDRPCRQGRPHRRPV